MATTARRQLLGDVAQVPPPSFHVDRVARDAEGRMNQDLRRVVERVDERPREDSLVRIVGDRRCPAERVRAGRRVHGRHRRRRRDEAVVVALERRRLGDRRVARIVDVIHGARLRDGVRGGGRYESTGTVPGRATSQLVVSAVTLVVRTTLAVPPVVDVESYVTLPYASYCFDPLRLRCDVRDVRRDAARPIERRGPTSCLPRSTSSTREDL